MAPAPWRRPPADLFDDPNGAFPSEPLGDGAWVLRSRATHRAAELLADIELIQAAAPLRHLVVPGGKSMSVAMTNCGNLGWISDRQGYRYASVDPQTGRRWPAMPCSWQALAQSAAGEAGYPDFLPDACLINRYVPGARMSAHRDQDESDLQAPIVSVSLGLTARFLWGGLARGGPVRRIALKHGDIVVWGGSSRLVYHGVAPLAAGEHPLLGAARYNLTFRKAR